MRIRTLSLLSCLSLTAALAGCPMPVMPPDTGVFPDTQSADVPPGTDVVRTDGMAPDTVTPDGSSPDTVIPDGASPDTVTPPDAAMDGNTPDTVLPDGALPDTVLPDTVLPDGALPDVVRVDGGDAGMTGTGICGAALVDLATAGSTVGSTTTYNGDSTSAPNMVSNPLPMNCSGGVAVRQVAHRYVTTAANQNIQITTGGGLDTILWAQSNCATGPATTSYSCNDDFGSGLTSGILVNGLPAGTEIFILVGVYASSSAPMEDGGAYTLEVAASAPIAIGGTCDPTADIDLCIAGSTCVAGGSSGMCLANGAANTACRLPSDPMGECNAGLECRSNTCVAPIAVGMGCDRTESIDRCTTGSTCVGPFAVGVCTNDGTAPNALCRAGDVCDAGLTCVPGASGDPSLCKRPIADGAACDYSTAICSGATSQCVPENPNTPSGGVCRSDGSLGGFCSDTVTCAMGTCSRPTSNGGICRQTVAMGESCDPRVTTPTGAPSVTNNPFYGRSVCGTGLSCAPGAGGSFSCQTNGAVAGAGCTGSCTSPLTCSVTTGSGICFSTAATGAACDPFYGSIQCTSPEACAARSMTAGVCTATTTEGDDTANNDFMNPPAITLPATITGSLAADDLDCFRFTTTATRSFVIATNDGKGGCAADEDTVIYLTDAMGNVLDTNDESGIKFGCSVINGLDAGSPSHNLPAGTYGVCVNPYSDIFTPAAPIARYVLDIFAQ